MTGPALRIRHDAPTRYIDPTVEVTGNGTFESPHQSWANVPKENNVHILQKIGTTDNLTNLVDFQNQSGVGFGVYADGNREQVLGQSRATINSTAGAGEGILDARDASDIHVDDLNFIGLTGTVYGLYLRTILGNDFHVRVSSCSFSGLRYGAVLEGMNDTEVSDCEFDDQFFDSLWLSGATETRVLRNRMSGFRRSGIRLNGVAGRAMHSIEVSENEIAGANQILGYAVWISKGFGTVEGTDFLVEKNKITGAVWGGIYLDVPATVRVNNLKAGTNGEGTGIYAENEGVDVYANNIGYFADGVHADNCDVIVRNTILEGCTTLLRTSNGGTVTYDYCNLRGGAPVGTGITNAGSNLFTDPGFRGGDVVTRNAALVGAGVALPGITRDILDTLYGDPPAIGSYADAEEVSHFRGGGPDITDTPHVIARRPSRYDRPDWQEWDEDDERALQAAIKHAPKLRTTEDAQIVLEGLAPIQDQPKTLEQQAREVRPMVDQIQLARGITRREAIEMIASGVDAQLVAAHRDQLITDDELLVLLLTVM